VFEPGHAGGEFYHMGALLASVYILTSLNTIAFLWQLQRTWTDVNWDAISVQQTKDTVRTYTVVVPILFIISVGISVALAIYVFATVAFSKSQPANWGAVIELNEVVCILLFLLFVVADLICIKAFDILKNERLGPHTLERVRARLKESHQYYLACDWPGLIGAVVILVVTRWISHSMTNVPKYWYGFSAGALALHIVFSQTILILLFLIREPEYEEIRVPHIAEFDDTICIVIENVPIRVNKETTEVLITTETAMHIESLKSGKPVKRTRKVAFHQYPD
jgi:hypothetical protein